MNARFSGQRMVKALVLMAALAVASLALAPAAEAGGRHQEAGVVPPHQTYKGKTYGQWSARWWQWCFSMSVGTPYTHPLFVDGNVDLSEGQSGPVWFLGGTLISTDIGGVYYGTAERTGTVPAGKALFFPIMNAEQSYLESWAFGGSDTTQAELRSDAKSFTDPAADLTCEVDGRPLSNLDHYRVQSPLYRIGPFPQDNIFESSWGIPDELDLNPPPPRRIRAYTAGAAPGNFTQSVSDGYYIMLAPLSVGEHTIHFSGDVPGFFYLDITYHIIVTCGNPHECDRDEDRDDD